MQSLLSGQINPVNAVVLIVVSVLAGLAGGALGGLKVGGKLLGNGTAAMIGSFFGLTAAVPSTILGLIILVLTAQ